MTRMADAAKDIDVIRGLEAPLNRIERHFDTIIAERDRFFSEAIAAERRFTAERYERSQQRFDAQEKAVSAALEVTNEATKAALAAAERAVAKAETATEKRFEGVNEFRKQLSDQTATFIARVEAMGQITNLREKIDALTTRLERTEGQSAGLSSGWGYLVGAIGLLATLLGIGGVLVAFSRGTP